MNTHKLFEQIPEQPDAASTPEVTEQVARHEYDPSDFESVEDIAQELLKISSNHVDQRSQAISRYLLGRQN